MGQTSSYHGGSSSSNTSNRASKRNSKYNKSFSLRHSRFGNDKRQSKMLTQDQIYEKLRNARNQKCGTLPLNVGVISKANDNPDPQRQEQQQSNNENEDVLLRGERSLPSQPNIRPITISEMNTFNTEKMNNSSTAITNSTLNNQSSYQPSETTNLNSESSSLQR